MKPNDDRLSKALLELGLVSEAGLEELKRQSAETGRGLLRQVLAGYPQMRDRMLADLARHVELDLAEVRGAPIHPQVLALVPADVAHRFGILPLARKKDAGGERLFVATANPFPDEELQALAALTSSVKVSWLLSAPTDLDEALEAHYGPPPKPRSAASKALEDVLAAQLSARADDRAVIEDEVDGYQPLRDRGPPENLLDLELPEVSASEAPGPSRAVPLPLPHGKSVPSRPPKLSASRADPPKRGGPGERGARPRGARGVPASPDAGRGARRGLPRRTWPAGTAPAEGLSLSKQGEAGAVARKTVRDAKGSAGTPELRSSQWAHRILFGPVEDDGGGREALRGFSDRERADPVSGDSAGRRGLEALPSPPSLAGTRRAGGDAGRERKSGSPKDAGLPTTAASAGTSHIRSGGSADDAAALRSSVGGSLLEHWRADSDVDPPSDALTEVLQVDDVPEKGVADAPSDASGASPVGTVRPGAEPEAPSGSAHSPLAGRVALSSGPPAGDSPDPADDEKRTVAVWLSDVARELEPPSVKREPREAPRRADSPSRVRVRCTLASGRDRFDLGAVQGWLSTAGAEVRAFVAHWAPAIGAFRRGRGWRPSMIGLAVGGFVLVLVIGFSGRESPSTAPESTEPTKGPNEVVQSRHKAAYGAGSELEIKRQAIAPGVYDEPALPGHAFVGEEGARLYATADAKGRSRGRLSAGQRVEQVRVLDKMIMVVVREDGRVGYVRRDRLTETFPLSVLAERLKFAPCTTEGPRTLDDCLAAAKEQFNRCRDGCRAYPNTRCPEACGAAFEGCLRRCRARPRGAERRRSTRRR